MGIWGKLPYIQCNIQPQFKKIFDKDHLVQNFKIVKYCLKKLYGESIKDKFSNKGFKDLCKA